MYICVCSAVTERQVREAVDAGAQSLHDLRRDLGVANECGRCAGCAKQCLQHANKKNTHHHHRVHATA